MRGLRSVFRSTCEQALAWPRCFTLAQGGKQTKMARSTARFSATCLSPIFMAISVTCSRCVCDRVRACVCVCVRACVCRFVGAECMDAYLLISRHVYLHISTSKRYVNLHIG